MLVRGIKPFTIFEELQEIGLFKAFPFTDKMPDIETIDLDKFFLYWEIFFVGQTSEDDVKDVFMFYYEDEYLIEKISFADFFTEDKALTKYKIIEHQKISIEKLRSQTTEMIEKLGININIATAEKTALPNIIEIPATKKVEIPIQTIIKESTETSSKPIESIKVSSAKLDELINLVSELVTLNSGMEILAKEIKHERLLRDIKEVTKLSKRFRDNALELRLVPIETMMIKFKRMIRDLSIKLNKSVEFIIEGSKTELDKNIIDKLEAPLMHIIRNAIDHAIEPQEERIALNKPETGVIRLIAFYSGANVFIQIQDDGRGIDTEMIRQKAIEKNIIAHNQVLTEKEIYEIIFLPGFSTSKNLTE